MFQLHPSPGNQALCLRHPKKFSLKRGLPVTLLQNDEPGFRISRLENTVLVRAQDLSAYYRALGELAMDPKLRDLSRQAPLRERALMLDCSRNAVYRLDFLMDRLLPDLALMGYNAFCLYTEDTYEVEGHPLIGYRRGGYSIAELRQLDDRAHALGIEMFPCIQTLGHLFQVLKYRPYWPAKDTGHTLSTLTPEADKLLKAMIRSAAKPYRSKRIHVGMDETADIGRGSSFRTDKKMDPRGLYLAHLKKVAGICKGMGLEPVMWGDMLLHFGSPKKGASPLPKNMDVVYWSYWDDQVKNHEKNVARLQAWGADPWVAPALLTEDRLWSLYAKVESAAGAILTAAKKHGAGKAMMTVWGDDGADAPLLSGYPALAFFGDHCWVSKPSRAQTQALTKTVSGAAWKSFIEPSDLECLDKPSLAHGANPSRGLLWDDPMLRIYAAHMGSRRVAPRLARTAKALAGNLKAAPKDLRPQFSYAAALGAYLALKADLGNDVAGAYRRGNKAALRASLRGLPKARRALRALWLAHRGAWLDERRSIGLEVLDQRYGGAIARLEVLQINLKAHLAGRQAKIQEFDQKDQVFLGKFPDIFWLWRTWGILSSGGTVF
jgi:hypothetical protein